MVAPFGVLASTALLVYLTEPEADGFREFVRVAQELVDLGAVVYAAAVVSAERGVSMIFWALEQRKKYIAERIAHNERVTALWREEGREKGRTEGRTEGLAEGRTEGRAEGRTEGLAEGRAEGRVEAYTAIMDAIRGEANGKWEEVVERVARERGIIPDDTPPPNGSN